MFCLCHNIIFIFFLAFGLYVRIIKYNKFYLSFSFKYLSSENEVLYIREKLKKQKFIIHAGGVVQKGSINFSYTSSREALLKTFTNGFQFCELDFKISKDKSLLCIRKWNQLFLNNSKIRRKISKKTFLKCKIYNIFTPITLEYLCEFVKIHPNFYFITDTKDDLILSAKIIKRDCPNNYNNFIIQIYHPDQYNSIHNLGFTKIILTLYRLSEKDRRPDFIINFSKKNSIIGITYWHFLVNDYLNIFKSEKISSFIHTVNNITQMKDFFNRGVSAIYSDINDFF